MVKQGWKLRANHVGSIPRPAHPLGRGVTPQRIRSTSPPTFNLEHVRKRILPRDKLIRLAATAAGALRPVSQRIKYFDRVLRVYCSISLGYEDRHVVQEFVYIRLKQMLDEHWCRVCAQLKESTGPRQNDQRLREAANRIMPIRQEHLERMVQRIFRGIEVEIMALVEYGRPLKVELVRKRRNVRAVLGHVGEKTGRKCVLIVEQLKDGDRVLAFKTEAKFKRSVGRKTHPKTQSYSNRPPQLRH